MSQARGNLYASKRRRHSTLGLRTFVQYVLTALRFTAVADGLPRIVEEVSIVWQRGAKLQFSEPAPVYSGRAEWAGQVLKQARRHTLTAVVALALLSQLPVLQLVGL